MRRRYIIVLTGLTLAALFVGTAESLHAQARDTGLQVAPVRSYTAQNPGSTTMNTVTVTNNTNEVATTTLSSENFDVVDEAYTYRFQAEESANWIRFTDTTIVLQPQEAKTIGYSLALPTNASPGGYYIALFVSTTNTSSNGAFQEVKRVASLIYLTVNGKVQRSGELLSLDMPWLSAGRQVDVVTRVANTGNIHQDSRIELQYKPLFFGATKSEIQQAMILPRSVRQLQTKLSLNSVWPSIYRVQATYAKPQGGTTNLTRTLIYIPPWFGISLIIIVVLAVSRLLRIKRNKKRK